MPSVARTEAALVLRVYFANVEIAALPMADVAAFSKSRSVGKRMGSGGDFDVTARAGRRNRLHGIDRPLRVYDRVQTGWQVLLAAVHMAHRTVACVVGTTLRAHRRKMDIREVVVASSEAHNRVALIVRIEILASMNPVDH